MRRLDLRACIAQAPMSAALIALNVAVFLAVTIDGRLLDVVSLPPGWAGVAERPWTLVTVFFASEALVHVAAAVFIIGVVGVRLERAAGSVHVLGVYLLAGVVGSLALVATAAATGHVEPSVGASAAFLGLMGALAMAPRGAWGARLPLDKVVVVVLAIQLAPIVGFGDWVSSAAHAAGLAIGAAYACLLRTRARELPDAPVASR